jgi:lipopolysaccharide/colanic/teichoic acid biosynthesis glycosyltransferase
MALDPVRKSPSGPSAASGDHDRELGVQSGPRLSAPRPAWEAAYTRWVIASDTTAVVLVGAAGAVLAARRTDPTFAVASGLLVVVTTLLTTYLSGAWDRVVLGDGGGEYRRLVRGFAVAAAVLGLAGLAAHVDYVRAWVFCIVPLAGLLAFAGRIGLRRWLHRRRRAGECTHPVLAVGSPEAVADLISRTRRDRHHGWAVTGACTPTGAGLILGVPVVGDLDAVAGVTRRGRYRIVSVGPVAGWTSARLHRLAWDIEETGAEMVVDPRLVEVAGPRLRTVPVDGLPLLHVSRPTLGGAGRLTKAVVDRLCAAILLLLLVPLLLVLAVAVRSGGPGVLHRETRIGQNGQPFSLLRFRTTVDDPEARVTEVGSWMRRYALDELPQLFNVLGGTMSLVGPRPPRPSEVVRAARAFPVKPGLTGLWQVGGDEAMSWEETARLDLRYVQHWSLITDAMIIGKAVGAICRNEKVY